MHPISANAYECRGALKKGVSVGHSPLKIPAAFERYTDISVPGMRLMFTTGQIDISKTYRMEIDNDKHPKIKASLQVDEGKSLGNGLTE